MAIASTMRQAVTHETLTKIIEAPLPVSTALAVWRMILIPHLCFHKDPPALIITPHSFPRAPHQLPCQRASHVPQNPTSAYQGRFILRGPQVATNLKLKPRPQGFSRRRAKPRQFPLLPPTHPPPPLLRPLRPARCMLLCTPMLMWSNWDPKL